MLILTIRTDKPESELGLYDNEKQIAYEIWEAHRRLAETLHTKIDKLLKSQNKALSDIDALIVYKGPGSFTGLRIGLSVANALAYGQGVPVVAETDAWIESGVKRLLVGDSDKIAIPEYGSPVHITTPRK